MSVQYPVLGVGTKLAGKKNMAKMMAGRRARAKQIVHDIQTVARDEARKEAKKHAKREAKRIINEKIGSGRRRKK
jgi:hypothetical protein